MISRFFNWVKRKLGIHKYEIIYTVGCSWNINNQEYGPYNEYCRFNIGYNEYLDDYKLTYSGYKPTQHQMYDELFRLKFQLKNRTMIIYENKIYNTKKLLEVSLKNEDYRYADYLQKYMKHE